MGWASGFSAGTSMAKQWIDTYREAEKRGLMAEAKKKADLGEYDRYSQESANKLHELAGMTDSRGRRVYDLQIAPGSTTYNPVLIDYGDSEPSGYTPALEYPASRGLGAEPSPVAQAFGVERPEYSVRQRGGIPSGTEDEGRFPLYAEPGMRLSEGRPEVSSVVGGTPVAPDAAPAREETGLTTSAPEYTPTLDMYRPQDTQAYAGLTRPGEQGAIGPDKTVYMGREYARGTLTDAEKRAAQQEEYAAVHERLGDPESAMRLRQAAAQERRAEAAETRAAELHPLQLGAAKQNLETGAVQLEDLKISAADKKRVREWDAFRAANPGAPLKTMLAKADELGIGVETQNKMITALTGVKTSEMAHTKTLITSMVKDMTLPEMLAAHKDNDMISPGRHYETVQDANGNLSLFLVDTATGKKVSEAPEFTGSPQQTEAYLRAAATDRATLLEVTQNIKKFEADLREKESVAARNQAYARTGGTGAGAGATREYVAMVGEARMLSAEIERLTGVVNDKTADPKLRKSAEARLNDALSQYEEVNKAIRGMRGLGGGNPAPTDRGRLYKAGIPFPGPDGKTLYVLDKDTYEFDIAPGMAKEFKGPATGGAVDVGAKSGTGVATTGGAKTTPPAQSVKKSTADEIADIESRLATDDRIKDGGLGGIGGRAIREGAFPMGIGERRDLERRLEELKRKR